MRESASEDGANCRMADADVNGEGAQAPGLRARTEDGCVVTPTASLRATSAATRSNGCMLAAEQVVQACAQHVVSSAACREQPTGQISSCRSQRHRRAYTPSTPGQAGVPPRRVAATVLPSPAATPSRGHDLSELAGRGMVSEPPPQRHTPATPMDGVGFSVSSWTGARAGSHPPLPPHPWGPRQTSLPISRVEVSPAWRTALPPPRPRLPGPVAPETDPLMVPPSVRADRAVSPPHAGAGPQRAGQRHPNGMEAESVGCAGASHRTG